MILKVVFSLLIFSILEDMSTEGTECLPNLKNLAVYEGDKNILLNLTVDIRIVEWTLDWTMVPTSDEFGSYSMTDPSLTGLFLFNPRGLLILEATTTPNVGLHPISTAGLYIAQCANKGKMTAAKLLVVRYAPECSCNASSPTYVQLSCSILYADGTIHPIYANMTWKIGDVVYITDSPIRIRIDYFVFKATSTITVDSSVSKKFTCTVTFNKPTDIEYEFIAKNEPQFSASCSVEVCSVSTTSGTTITTTPPPTTTTLSPTTTTQTPSNTTQTPSTTTQAPSNTTQTPSTIPSTISQAPSTTTQVPSNTTQTPSTTTQTPSTIPSTISQSPSTITQTPSTTTQKPSTIPSTISQAPSTTTQAPSNTTQTPSTTTQTPSTIPSTISQAPSTTTHKPSTTTQTPSTTTQTPSTTAQLPRRTTPRKATTQPPIITIQPPTSTTESFTKTEPSTTTSIFDLPSSTSKRYTKILSTTSQPPTKTTTSSTIECNCPLNTACPPPDNNCNKESECQTDGTNLTAGIYAVSVVKAELYTRYDKCCPKDLVWGVVVTLQNDIRWLIHDPLCNDDKCEMVVVDASCMSSDWTLLADRKITKSVVGDYLQTGNTVIGVNMIDCNESCQRMMNLS